MTERSGQRQKLQEKQKDRSRRYDKRVKLKFHIIF